MNLQFNAISFSNHALDRIRERGIDPNLVKEAVRSGSRSKNGARKIFRLDSFWGIPLHRKLIVVAEGPWVVTAYWRDEPSNIRTN